MRCPPRYLDLFAGGLLRKYSVQQSRFASALHHLSKNCGARRTAARQVKARRISPTVPEPKSKRN
jgi:hypothetical protein